MMRAKDVQRMRVAAWHARGTAKGDVIGAVNAAVSRVVLETRARADSNPHEREAIEAAQRKRERKNARRLAQ